VKVTTIGRGNVGGGLGQLWQQAGHEVVELGRDGGDCSGSDAALLAVPQTAIGDALSSVSGLESVPVIDAINAVRGPRPDGFNSLTEYVKSLTGGPVAKAFNANFATLYDRLGEARATPSMVYAADDEARGVTRRSSATPASSRSPRAASRMRAPSRTSSASSSRSRARAARSSTASARRRSSNARAVVRRRRASL
jgi:8-hydroxy-5-deazaflavin:NADPH oxidoreductase